MNKDINTTLMALVPIGRMKFIHKDRGKINSPNFQSVYVCSGVLERQITFSNCEF